MRDIAALLAPKIEVGRGVPVALATEPFVMKPREIQTVAFVAAVLGVGYLNLPAAIAATEAGAFLTGTLCGFAGVTVLATLSRAKKVEA